MMVTRGLLSGLVAASLLLGASDGRAASGAIGVTAASAQVTVAEPTLLPVVLPDLSRMHRSVQEQMREAYASLMALESGERLCAQAPFRCLSSPMAMGESVTRTSSRSSISRVMATSLFRPIIQVMPGSPRYRPGRFRMTGPGAAARCVTGPAMFLS